MVQGDTSKVSADLISLPIPRFLREQISLFTPESLHAKKAKAFNPFKSLQKLSNQEGFQTIVVDIGGDHIEIGVLRFHNGYPETDPEKQKILRSTSGTGYIDLLEEAAKLAQELALPVGISYGGPLDGTKPLFHPKLGNFYRDLNERCGGDLRNIFPSPIPQSIENDAISGIKAGAIEAVKKFGPTFSNVLYIISGGGLGGSVLKKEGEDFNIYSLEPGHVQVVKPLNPYSQDTPCGVFNNRFVCIERVVASGEGVEAIWKKKTGEAKDGKEISILYQSGDKLARGLYDNSAYGLAHTIMGINKALELNPAKTVVVCQGGIFKTPQYGQRAAQLVTAYGSPARFIMMPEITDNASRDGAAISTLLTIHSTVI